MYISKVFRMIPHTPHHNSPPLRQQKCPGPVVSDPGLDERGSSMDQCYVLPLTSSGKYEPNYAGIFEAPFCWGANWPFFSNHGSQGRETLRFIIRFLGYFSKQPRTGFLSPSNHHKTVGSIYSGIAVSCCSQASPKDPQWHSPLDLRGQRSDQGTG